MDKCKVGNIHISNVLYFDEKSSDWIGELFKVFRPYFVRPSSLFPGCIELKGYCAQFEELNEGDEIPCYDVTITTTSNLNIPTITFSKSKQ